MNNKKFRMLNFPAHKYFHMAGLFARSGKLLCDYQQGSASLPTYYLFCHSIELGLKGFLRLNEIPSVDLRAKGHNLTKLHTDCLSNGLLIPGRDSDADGEIITKLNKYYQNKQFEYMELGGWLLMPISVVSDYTFKLLDTCARYSELRK